MAHKYRVISGKLKAEVNLWIKGLTYSTSHYDLKVHTVTDSNVSKQPLDSRTASASELEVQDGTRTKLQVGAGISMNN